MNPAEREILHACFEKTKEMFQTKNRAEDWSDNIIEGSRFLKTKLQWKHFYSWLANPTGYSEKETDLLPTSSEKFEIPQYPDNMRVQYYPNGSETIVCVTNPIYDSSEDEKTE